MARAIWRGSISFGLVTVPVRLYAAVRRQDVRFRELDRRTAGRVRHQRVRDLELTEFEPPPTFLAGTRPRSEGPEWRQEPAPARARELQRAPESQGENKPALDSPPPAHTPSPVERTDVVRGFEVAPGRYVEVTDEDLAELEPERTRTIDVEQFVARGELDPIYFETAYYVVPDLDRVRPFAVLLRALQQSNKAAIAWIVLRSRRHLAALQPRGDLMLLTTLLFADEVVSPESLAPPLPADLTGREVDMAELLVQTLSGPFEPTRYRDDYRERLLALIEQRAGDAVEVAEPPPPAPAGIEDLMAALAASVDRARAERQAADAMVSEPERRPARRRRA